MDETIADDANSCKDFCVDVTDCSWFTYNSVDGACLLLEDCQHLDAECDTCLSGRKDCSDPNKGKFDICFVLLSFVLNVLCLIR